MKLILIKGTIRLYYRKLIFLVYVILFLSIGAKSQTQNELTVQSSEELKIAQRKLDSVYLNIILLYHDDTVFIMNLKKSQNFWQKYYSVQIIAMFPNYPSETGRYGSMLPMCKSIYARSIVVSRIKELEVWLIGSEQGECGSSKKPQEYLPPYKQFEPKN